MWYDIVAHEPLVVVENNRLFAARGLAHALGNQIMDPLFVLTLARTTHVALHLQTVIGFGRTDGPENVLTYQWSAPRALYARHRAPGNRASAMLVCI